MTEGETLEPHRPRRFPFTPGSQGVHDREMAGSAGGHRGQGDEQFPEGSPVHLESAEDQLDGSVDFSGLRCVEAACEVSEAAGVDGSHLVDQYEGPGAVHLDLGAEDRGLGAGGCRGDDEGGEQDRVALDRDCVPRAALLVARGVLPGRSRYRSPRTDLVQFLVHGLDLG